MAQANEPKGGSNSRRIQALEDELRSLRDRVRSREIKIADVQGDDLEGRVRSILATLSPPAPTYQPTASIALARENGKSESAARFSKRKARR